MKESDAQKKFREAGEVILGGVEVHVKFTRVQGDPGIMLDFAPPAGTDSAPPGADNINGVLAGFCRETVMNMDDDARLRLLALVERDGGRDRMLYRLTVTVWIDANGKDGTTVSDWIDPAFAGLDAGVAGRALECRNQIEQLLSLAGAGMEEQVESTEMFEIIGTTKHLPGIKERTEEEARQAMLEGEEFMLLEIQVIGSLEKYRGRDYLSLDYIAAMSGKALSSEWMKKKIRLISKVCENTIMGISNATTRRLSAAIRKTESREFCPYRLSVWGSMNDDGSPRYSIWDQIDPAFAENDPAAERRAVEARRLAGMVMGGEPG
ncbi:MAG: hypothetical protein WC379_17085 [Methanoregula sp.]|jgi:hypothetical protein